MKNALHKPNINYINKQDRSLRKASRTPKFQHLITCTLACEGESREGNSLNLKINESYNVFLL